MVKDENCLSKLADGIDALYTMVKEIMPNEDGVPMGEETERKQGGFQDSSQKHRKTPPMPTLKHGAKKHPANGRFSVKAEW